MHRPKTKLKMIWSAHAHGGIACHNNSGHNHINMHALIEYLKPAMNATLPVTCTPQKQPVVSHASIATQRVRRV